MPSLTWEFLSFQFGRLRFDATHLGLESETFEPETFPAGRHSPDFSGQTSRGKRKRFFAKFYFLQISKWKFVEKGRLYRNHLLNEIENNLTRSKSLTKKDRTYLDNYRIV